jgi:hypothetical protein
MGTKVIEELSAEEFMKQIYNKNKLHQAIALQAVEDSFANELLEWKKKNPIASHEEFVEHNEINKTKFRELRKIFLDWSNEYTRSIIKLVFGSEYEGNLK